MVCLCSGSYIDYELVFSVCVSVQDELLCTTIGDGLHDPVYGVAGRVGTAWVDPLDAWGWGAEVVYGFVALTLVPLSRSPCCLLRPLLCIRLFSLDTSSHAENDGLSLWSFQNCCRCPDQPCLLCTLGNAKRASLGVWEVLESTRTVMERHHQSNHKSSMKSTLRSIHARTGRIWMMTM